MKRAVTVGVVTTVLVLGLVCVDEAAAFEDGADVGASPEYGMYYGDGLRHLAERRPEEAVEALFRAYGIQPSAHVMGLIVEAYDQLGDCDAVRRQVAFLESHHDGEAPALDRCGDTGEVVVKCQGKPGEYAVIDGRRRVRCGEVVEVPAGEAHYIRWSFAGDPERVTVEEGKRQQVSFGSSQVEIPGLVAQVRRLPVGVTEGISVPRLPSPSLEEYRIYEADDGLYHIWAAEDGAASAQDGAQVEMICPEDSSDRAQCVWVRERGEVAKDEEPTGYEIFVPRLP